MKKLFTLLFLVCCVWQTQAQQLSKTDSDLIDKKVDVFLGMMGDKNYTGVLNLMYPKFFEHTPKAQIFQVFQLMQQAGIDLKFNDFEVMNKELVPSNDNNKYALIQYKMDLELPLKTDELKSMASFMVPMIEQTFGKSNVEYNQAENYVRVNAERYLIGIEDEAFGNDWLFLIYDSSFKSSLEKTLPTEVNQVAAARAY